MPGEFLFDAAALPLLRLEAALSARIHRGVADLAAEALWLFDGSSLHHLRRAIETLYSPGSSREIVVVSAHTEAELVAGVPHWRLLADANVLRQVAPSEAAPARDAVAVYLLGEFPGGSGADATVRAAFDRCRARRKAIIEADGRARAVATRRDRLAHRLWLRVAPWAARGRNWLFWRVQRRLQAIERDGGDIRRRPAPAATIARIPTRLMVDPRTGNCVKPDYLRDIARDCDYGEEYFATGILECEKDWASALEEYQESFWRRMQRVGLEPPGPGARPRALDIGCGTGALAGKLAQLGFEASGCDTSEHAIAMALREQGKPERARFIPREVRFRCGGVDAFEGARFDLVTLVHVIEHIPTPTEFMAQLRNLLAPNGVLYVETTVFSAAGRLLRPDWLWQADHCAEYSVRGLRALIESAGFTVREHAAFDADDPALPYQALKATIPGNRRGTSGRRRRPQLR